VRLVRMYDSRDVLGVLPGWYATVVEAARVCVGVRSGYVDRVVSRVAWVAE
jgi:hypothetical protein